MFARNLVSANCSLPIKRVAKSRLGATKWKFPHLIQESTRVRLYGSDWKSTINEAKSWGGRGSTSKKRRSEREIMRRDEHARLQRELKAERDLLSDESINPDWPKPKPKDYKQLYNMYGKVRDFDDTKQLERAYEKLDQYVQIPRRGMIEVSGPDASVFLQGMQCNDMKNIDSGGPGMYTAFLTPQGRTVCDAFIYPINKDGEFPEPRFLIEIDQGVTERLLKLLEFYKLRANISITDATYEYSVWAVWGANSSSIVGRYTKWEYPEEKRYIFSNQPRIADIWMQDKRGPEMGIRGLTEAGSGEPVLPDWFDQMFFERYTMRRILKGVAEGPTDFVPETSVPLMCNIDYMNGVDFNKGCYVGQELTIRTHHRGVVRKRIVPVVFSSVHGTPTKEDARNSDLRSLQGYFNPLRIDPGFPEDMLPLPQSDIYLAGETPPESVKNEKDEKGSESSEGTEESSEGTEKSSEGVEESSEGTEKSSEGVEESSEGTEKSSEGVEESSEGTEKSSEGVEESSEGTEKSSEGVEESSEGTEESSEGTEKSSEGTEKSSEGTEKSSEGTEKSSEGIEKAAAAPKRPRRKAQHGNICGSVYNIGLALMRIDEVEAFIEQQRTGKSKNPISFKVLGADGSELYVSPWIPSWWPSPKKQ